MSGSGGRNCRGSNTAMFSNMYYIDQDEIRPAFRHRWECWISSEELNRTSGCGDIFALSVSYRRDCDGGHATSTRHSTSVVEVVQVFQSTLAALQADGR